MAGIPFWVRAVVLFIGIVLSYVLGVRKGAAWGKALVALFVLCLVGMVLHRAFSARGRLPSHDEEAAGERTLARLLGEGLKEHLKPGSRIFIFSGFDPELEGEMIYTWPHWEKGLAEGLDDPDWQRVALYWTGDEPAVEDFSAGLAGLEGQIDAVISFLPLPADFSRCSIYQLAERPKVAAYFYLGEHQERLEVTEVIRQLLENGEIEAAVFRERLSLTLYTPDKLP